MRKKDRKQRLLTAGVLAALLAMPTYGYAFQRDPEYVYYNGKSMVEMQILNKGESLKDKDGDAIVAKAGYTLDDSLVEPVKSSTAYWTRMIGPKAKNGQPWQIFITTKKSLANASATTTSFYVNGKKPVEDADNYVAKLFQNGKTLVRVTEDTVASPLDGDYAFSTITIGQHLGAARQGVIDGWWVDTDTVLPTNEQAADFIGTFRHELGHALGILKEYDFLDDKCHPYMPKSEEDIPKYPNGEQRIAFSATLDDGKSWNMNLVDQNLNPAKPGMKIVSAAGFEELKKNNPALKKSDVFIVNNLSMGEDGSGRKGKAFFVGKNVTDALAGATFYGVSGLPVNGWEYDKFEGSHLQTVGMMSHRSYSNFTSFMEVELAVMQDMGYAVDREAYFGHSVYGDGGTITNTQGYFARNAEGTAYIPGTFSAVPLGIGLHIYGSRNTVTQRAYILTKGTGSTGVRVDGMRNTLVIPAATKIHADGLRGNGILVAYGRDQVVDQVGTVTANGQGGVGARFDFGSSSNGAVDEYRGSYIRFKREVDENTGAITKSGNLELTGMKPEEWNAAADELNGPQVREYNLSGRLEGGKHAIYIGRNALVKEINVNKGAGIKGDIVSDWKHFATGERAYDANGKNGRPLKIQYNDGSYNYDTYIPDLVTNLNFNAGLSYAYNITGPDNMKLNVKSGILNYAGTTDVVSVHVAKGASLFGGTYKVNDMTANLAEGFSDDTAGKFRNCGTIGTVSKDTAMKISGNLVSTGTLLGFAGGMAGTVAVTSSADIEGSKVIAKNLLPDEEFTVLKAASISGSVKNTEKAPYKFGMLDEVSTVEGNTAVVTGKAANNLGVADSVQAETYDAMMCMYNNLSTNPDGRRNEMRPLFTLTSATAKEALSAISSNASAQSMAVAQRSMMTHHVLSSRLNEAFMPKPVEIKLPDANLMDGNAGKEENVATQNGLQQNVTEQQEAGQSVANSKTTQLKNGNTENALNVSLNLLEPAENNIWLKFGKNWGDLKDGADYHSSTTLLGYDKAVAPHWRAGAFAGYSATSFSDSTAGNELKDTRFGLYAGYNKAGREALVYLDHGWMRNKLRRGLTNLGLTANAKYHSRILELGGEYLYDLHARKNVPWHVRPYVNAQLSRLWQDGYSEEGALVFNQVVQGKHNDYFGMGAGVEFKRYLPGGNYAVRAGIKHAFAGAEPKLRYSYMGDAANTYDMRNVQDKTHFVLSVGGETQVAKGWSIGGEASFTRGRHDKDFSCSVTVRRMW